MERNTSQISNGVDCLFCKIINRGMPADIIYEDEKVLAIKDIKPMAPIHVLAILKKHIASVNELTDADKELIGELISAGKKIAQISGVAETGYRLILNTGKDAGQTISHLHLHILGGTILP